MPAWLVPAQAGLAAAHVVSGGPRLPVPDRAVAPVRVVGAVAVVTGLATAGVSAAGLGRDLTASPVPRDGAALRTRGAFARVRHPVYLGLLVASGGAVLARQRVTTLLAACGLAGLLHVKAGVEDRVLEERFGQEWRDYAARVPRLVPGLRWS